MYEAVTYEEILQRMLDKLPNNLDKREGGILYDALAPVAMELQNAYISLDIFLDEVFADTATFEYLAKRAAERGIFPDEATKAILKAKFNCSVPIGSRFSLEENNYRVVQYITDFEYQVECETAGSIGNRYFGSMIPIPTANYIDGLVTAELTELSIPGEDEEDEEPFRIKYFSSFDSQAFGGNRADYKEKICGISGVGGAKIARRVIGDEFIRVCIIDSLFCAPTNELISLVQSTIDPEQNHGQGEGLAPIDHKVLISGVSWSEIDIEAILIMESGYTADMLIEQIKNGIDNYFLDLAKTWDSVETLVVRIAQIESRLLLISGILDITSTTINGNASNMTLLHNQLPKRGDVHVS